MWRQTCASTHEATLVPSAGSIVRMSLRLLTLRGFRCYLHKHAHPDNDCDTGNTISYVNIALHMSLTDLHANTPPVSCMLMCRVAAYPCYYSSFVEVSRFITCLCRRFSHHAVWQDDRAGNGLHVRPTLTPALTHASLPKLSVGRRSSPMAPRALCARADVTLAPHTRS